MLKSNKGYSLIEIGVGIIMLTVFLLVSIGLFNGSYNNYRRIHQRNNAIDHAVLQLENMLNTDKDELTGFFVQKLDSATNTYSLKPSDYFVSFIKDKYREVDLIRQRYSSVIGSSPDSIDEDEAAKFIENDRDYLINYYIKDTIREGSLSEAQLSSGDYAFIIDNEPTNEYVVEYVNGRLVSAGTSTLYVATKGQPLKVRRTVKRIGAENGIAYGNEVLKLKVEVFYSEKFGESIQESDMKSIVLETVKYAS